VDEALVEFAQAQAAGDASTMLKAQRKLLDAAAAAQPVADGDASAYGKQLRGALDEVTAAETGGYDQMVDAHKTLALLGGSPDTAGTPVAMLPKPPDQNKAVGVAQATADLTKAVNEYNAAGANGNQKQLLTAQKDLLTSLNEANSASKTGTTADALALQKVVVLLNDGLRGDNGKFQDAAAALGAMNPQTGADTAAAGTTPSAATAAAGHPVDLQPFQNDLDNKLQTLQNQQGNSDKAGLAKAQADVKESIQKAQDALADDHSPAANKMRDALGHAGEAAGGDTSKIQLARDQLKAALGQ
jgi:hypothetical protein